MVSWPKVTTAQKCRFPAWKCAQGTQTPPGTSTNGASRTHGSLQNKICVLFFPQCSRIVAGVWDSNWAKMGCELQRSQTTHQGCTWVNSSFQISWFLLFYLRNSGEILNPLASVAKLINFKRTARIFIPKTNPQSCQVPSSGLYFQDDEILAEFRHLYPCLILIQTRCIKFLTNAYSDY